jgi:sugar phosphate isomerase/epimerase
MRVPRGFELTYCTNIHAAEGWPHVFEQLKRYAPELKSRLAPDADFGLGLRLSNAEAAELVSGDRLDEFARFLQERKLYVALINGFPYGWFHERRLKDQVFAPDWHTNERVDYTLRLVEILRRLLPEHLDGGVSTCPLSYKHWSKKGRPDWKVIIQNVVRVASAMAQSGRDIHLDIEPEPDGLVETAEEFIEFFNRLVSEGAPLLASSAQLSISEAEDALRRHVALCFDLCHSAVEGERPHPVLDALRREGIRIGRVQISSAIKALVPENSAQRVDLGARLSQLADPVYLHQTIGDAERYPDLPQALDELTHARSSEWRIHYHVPLFVEGYGDLGSTQAEVRDALLCLDPAEVRHLEIETYTWSVLPEHLRLDLTDSIQREYEWVMAQL